MHSLPNLNRTLMACQGVSKLRLPLSHHQLPRAARTARFSAKEYLVLGTCRDLTASSFRFDYYSVSRNNWGPLAVKEKVGDSSNYLGVWSPPSSCVELYACGDMLSCTNAMAIFCEWSEQG